MNRRTAEERKILKALARLDKARREMGVAAAEYYAYVVHSEAPNDCSQTAQDVRSVADALSGMITTTGTRLRVWLEDKDTRT